jgi:hypothetical protein
MPRMTRKAPISSDRKRGRNPSRGKSVKFGYAPNDIASQIRGLYRRVALALDVDPSYVSRVARSERRSKAVADALRRELAKIIRNIRKARGSGSRKAVRKK